MSKPKKDRRTAYQKEVDRLYERLTVVDPASKEYKEVLDRLRTMTEIDCRKKEVAKDHKGRDEVIKTLVVGAIGIVEILTILGCEKEIILPKKALDLVLRGRV